MSSIQQSIFGLAKNNNGMFKSDAQKKFLTSELKAMEGWIGYTDSGYNQCAVFAEWDDKGITKILKRTKSNGEVVMFERKEVGILTAKEIAQIKHVEKLLKKDITELKNRQTSFDNGTYSKDVPYSDDTISMFNSRQEKTNEVILRRTKLLKHLKAGGTILNFVE